MVRQLKEQILDLVRERAHISIPELVGELPAMEGDVALYFPSYPNAILWGALSEQAASALTALIVEEEIFLAHPHHPIRIPKGVPYAQLPIAEGFGNFEEPHWVPLLLWANVPPLTLRAHLLRWE